MIVPCDYSGQKKTKWGGVGWDVIALRLDLETAATEKRLQSERSGKRASTCWLWLVTNKTYLVCIGNHRVGPMVR